MKPYREHGFIQLKNDYLTKVIIKGSANAINKNSISI